MRNLKKLLAMALSAGLFFTALPAFAAESAAILKYDCFDDIATNGKPTGWTINNVNNNPVTVVEEEGKQNKVLFLDVKTGEVVMDFSIANAPNKMVSEGRFMTMDNAAEKKIFLQKDSAGKFNSYVSFKPDGYITLDDGRKLEKYEYGKWYHIAVIQNKATRRFDLMIDGKIRASDVIYGNLSFGVPSVTRLQVTTSGAPSTLYADDIKIYSGDTILEDSKISKPAYNAEVLEVQKEEEKPPVEENIEDTVYTYQTFDNNTTGSGPTGVNYDQKQSSITVVDVPSKKNKSVLIEKTSGDPLMNFNTSFSSTKVVFDAKVRTDDSSANKRLFILRDANGQFLEGLTFDTSGKIVASDGRSLGKFMRKKWYQVSLVMDFAARKSDAYLNGELVLEGIPFNNNAFSTPQMMRIQLNNDGGNAKFYIDYVAIYGGSALRDINTFKEDDTASGSSIFPSEQTTIKELTGSVAMVVDQKHAFADGEKRELDVPPFEANGRTMIPVRFVSEGFGGEVDWEEEAGQVTIQINGKTILMTVGEPRMTVDGKTIELDAAPVVVSDRTFIPLRAFAEEGLGQNVAWYDKGKMAVVGNAASLGDEQMKWAANYLIYERPGSERILEDFKAANQAHPRLFATGQDFEQLRSRRNEEPMKTWADNVIKKADGLIEAAPTPYQLNNLNQLLSQSRSVLDRAGVLGMAYQLTLDTKYADRLWKELETAGNYPDWNHHTHFLDTAEMTEAFAIGYDWAYDYYTKEQREFLRKNIVEKGLNQGIKCYHGQSGVNGGWVKWDWNWNVVCNGGLSSGALAIMDEEPELASYVIEQGLRFSEYMLPEFAPDGAWKEGPGYWQYTIQYLTFFMSGLQTALGTDYGYLALNNVDKTGYFPIYTSSAQGSFNFNDAGAGLVNSPQIFFFSDKVNDPDLARVRLNDMAAYGWGGNEWDLVFYNPDKVSENVNLPLDKYFGYTEVMSFRNAWNDKSAFFAAMAAGQNDAPHGNLDSGTFILDAMGERWAMDLGADDYGLPGYFDNNAQRWTYYRMRAEGQNTILINPGSGPDQVMNAFTVFTGHESKNKGGIGVIDMAPALGSDVKSAQRGMKMDQMRTRVVLQDEIEFNRPSNLWWFMHTQSKIEIAPDGKSAILSKNGKQLYVMLECSNDSAKFSQMDATPLPSSPPGTGQTPNTGVVKLAVNVPKASGKFTLKVTFVPLVGMRAEDVVSDGLIPIDEWTIPDGEYKLPQVSEIKADGVLLEDFSPSKTSYTITLPFGATEIPQITAKTTEGELELIQSTDLNVPTVIKVTDPSDPTSIGRYSVNYKVLPYMGAPEGMTEYPVKGVTASAEPQPENPKEAVLDGDYDTRWSADGEQWITLDLGEVQTVNAVGMAWYLGDTRTSTFDIAVSIDGKEFNTLTSGESSGLSAEIETFSVTETKARYVRILGHGNSTSNWNSYSEIRVYGKNAE